MIRFRINEDQIKAIETERKKNNNKNIEKRLKALLLHAHGEKRETIAQKTEFATSYISELVAKFCNIGLSAIVGNNYKGNRRNMSLDAEAELLETFKKAAEAGQLVEVSEIKRAYEEKLGRKIKSRGLIYEVLKRHGWRKIMPRSKHPNKASEEAMEASKKLSLV